MSHSSTADGRPRYLAEWYQPAMTDEWLEVMRQAHAIGMRGNRTTVQLDQLLDHGETNTHA